MDIKYLTRPTEVAKSFLEQALKKGDRAVDATMGNGNDTLFLANIVGEEGRVISFDIQDLAILNTRKLLENNHISNVDLIQDGHENMDTYICNEINGAMFNLGYLPKGEHHIVTKAKTTIAAIEKCLTLLKKNGIITIVIYYGHFEGKIEKEQVISYVENLEPKKFHVMKVDYINQAKEPPMLITIIKK
ncbi:class I SAM-dependent methyltransferase [Crassaminicella profunda]|uniref:class I SAM-dependent methyltransferase n=1 Tax=Crassaminicella profunda TaxID=1286698 RepID=UPI001CA7648D|nr:class I SAM-dependent methyltransferase [Crassaminicella profunda]QZY56880.1 methyltransferase domain-containing protein [Crassaminicella profunda]